jgi:hypothetical protein
MSSVIKVLATASLVLGLAGCQTAIQNKENLLTAAAQFGMVAATGTRLSTTAAGMATTAMRQAHSRRAL